MCYLSFFLSFFPSLTLTVSRSVHHNGIHHVAIALYIYAHGLSPLDDLTGMLPNFVLR
jgi:hypothetical protein